MTGNTSPTQAEIVRLGLERDIFSGRLSPGEPLNEAHIAEAYEMSRTPVREAISSLVRAGLITKQAQRRAVVTRLDVEKLLELFEALAELEGVAARLATARMSTDEKDALLTLHRRAEDQIDGEPNHYADLGRQFHQCLVTACRNQTLIDCTESLATRVNPFRRFQLLARDRIRSNQRDHDCIIKAVLDGDDERAGILLRQHTVDQGDVLVRYIALHKVSYSDVAKHYRSSDQEREGTEPRESQVFQN